MATHCTILAWKIPWTGEPGGLQLMGSQVSARLSAYSTAAAIQRMTGVTRGRGW